MNKILILNISTGKVAKFDSLEAVIEAYCRLSLKDKLLSFVLGISEDAMDYPAMMEYILNLDKGSSAR